MVVWIRHMLFGLILKVLESPITKDDLFNSKYHVAPIISLSVVHFILVKIGKRGVIIFITTILSPLFLIFTKSKSTDKNMIEAVWYLELNRSPVVIGLSKTFKMSPNNIYLHSLPSGVHIFFKSYVLKRLCDHGCLNQVYVVWTHIKGLGKPNNHRWSI